MSPSYLDAAGDLAQGTGKPRPRTDNPATAPHWAGASRSELVFQVCSDCEYVRWPAAPECPQCLSDRSRWKPVSPQGVLWSFCTYETAIDPVWADEVPYVVAAVQLDAGPFLYGRLMAPPDEPIIGSRVEAVFQSVDEVTLVQFALSNDREGLR